MTRSTQALRRAVGSCEQHPGYVLVYICQTGGSPSRAILAAYTYLRTYAYAPAYMLWLGSSYVRLITPLRPAGPTVSEFFHAVPTSSFQWV